MRESRRVAHITDRLFWTVGPADRWCKMPAGPGGQGSGPGTFAEKANDFNTGPGGPGGLGTKTTVAKNIHDAFSLPVGRRVQRTSNSFLTHGLHLYPDHPDHPDQA